MKKIAVLISGSGSNLYNLASKIKKDLASKCKIEIVISNNKNAGGLKHAEDFDIPFLILEDKSPKISIITQNAEDYNKFAELKLKANESFLKIKPFINNEEYSLLDLMNEAMQEIKTISKFPEEDFKENVLTDLLFEGMTANKNEIDEAEEDEILSKIDDILYDLIEDIKILTALFLHIRENPNFLQFFAREKYDAELSKVLEEKQIDYIFLAGFMRILSPFFMTKWQGKVINIHPSLLPSFKGAKAVKEALEYGVKITGCTVHFVEFGIDNGKILAQKSVEILPEDTEETLHQRIKEAEKELFPKVLEQLIEGKIV